jgi:hypothetical protein
VPRHRLPCCQRSRRTCRLAAVSLADRPAMDTGGLASSPGCWPEDVRPMVATLGAGLALRGTSAANGAVHNNEQRHRRACRRSKHLCSWLPPMTTAHAAARMLPPPTLTAGHPGPLCRLRFLTGSALGRVQRCLHEGDTKAGIPMALRLPASHTTLTVCATYRTGMPPHVLQQQRVSAHAAAMQGELRGCAPGTWRRGGDGLAVAARQLEAQTPQHLAVQRVPVVHLLLHGVRRAAAGRQSGFQRGRAGTRCCLHPLPHL